MVPEYRNLTNPRDKRLAQEHRLLDDFCDKSDLIDYEAIMRRGGLPPERYLFHYKVKSIIGIDVYKAPIYGEYHTAEVEIPPEFPLGGQPSCYMKTPLWHPNIKFDGTFSGKICLNAERLGDWHTIDMLAERIGEMLQYKNYHAINTPPYPEDAQAAEWVVNYAEPNKVVNKHKKKYVDHRPLLRVSPEWEQRRAKRVKEATGITIGIRRPAGMTKDEQKIILTPKRRSITVIKKR